MYIAHELILFTALTPDIDRTTMEKRTLGFWEIWNMSFGFMGIQFGWGLQMANMSLYEYLGAKPEEISMLWLAAPLTGLVVQPIIGAWSDPNLDVNWAAEAIFLGGCRSQFCGARLHAQFHSVVDGCRTSLDFGCQHQCQHGTIPSFCGGHAARKTAQQRFCHAKLHDWGGRRCGLCFALAFGQRFWGGQ